MKLTNLKILFKSSDDVVEEGTIVEEIANEHGVLSHVKARFKSQNRKVPLLAINSGKVLVPETQIPEKWRGILAAHPEVAVIYTDPQQETSGTSLVNRKSLSVLSSRIETIEYADLELGSDGVLYEGKPAVESCETIYACGEVEITLPEDPQRFQ